MRLIMFMKFNHVYFNIKLTILIVGQTNGNIAVNLVKGIIIFSGSCSSIMLKTLVLKQKLSCTMNWYLYIC